MQDSQLVQTLRLFSQQELVQLRQFASSSLFHQDPNRFNDTLSLFDHLLCFEQLQGDALRKEVVGEQLFPAQEREQRVAGAKALIAKRQKDRLEKAMSQLFGVVKFFITYLNYIELPADPSRQPKPLADAPDAAAGDVHFKKRLKKREALHKQKALKEDPVRFLNRSRQQLALLRFYNVRIKLQPTPQEAEEPQPLPHSPAHKAKRERDPENFFDYSFDWLQEHYELDMVIEDFAKPDPAQTRGKPEPALLPVEPVVYADYSNDSFAELNYNRFRLENELCAFQTLMNPIGGDLHLPQTIEALDWFYISTRLELTLRLLMQSTIVNLDLPMIDTKVDLARRIVKYAHLGFSASDQFQTLYQPIILIYEKAFSLLLYGKEDCDQDVEILEYLLRTHEKKLPLEAWKDFHTIVQNYLTKRYTISKEMHFLEKLHEKHKIGLDFYQDEKNRRKNTLTTHIAGKEYIHQSQLQNTITVALKLGKTEWARKFLKEFTHEKIFGGSQPDTVWEIHMANVFFHDGNFKQSLRWIKRIFGGLTGFHRVQNNHLRLLLARLAAKTLYELDELEADFVRNIRYWLENENDLLPERKKNNLDFFSLTTRLFKIGTERPVNLERIISVEQNIHADKPAEMEWLFKKADVLRKLAKQ